MEYAAKLARKIVAMYRPVTFVLPEGNTVDHEARTQLNAQVCMWPGRSYAAGWKLTKHLHVA